MIQNPTRYLKQESLKEKKDDHGVTDSLTSFLLERAKYAPALEVNIALKSTSLRFKLSSKSASASFILIHRHYDIILHTHLTHFKSIMASSARPFPFIKLEPDEKHAKSFLNSIPSGPDIAAAIVSPLSEHSALDYDVVKKKIRSQLGSLADRVAHRPRLEFQEPIQCEIERRRSQRQTAGLEPITPPHYQDQVHGRHWSSLFGNREATQSNVWREEAILQQVCDTTSLKDDSAD